MNIVLQVDGTSCSINIFSCKRSKSGPTFQPLSSSSVVFHCDFIPFSACTVDMHSHSSGGKYSSISAEDVICHSSHL